MNQNVPYGNAKSCLWYAVLSLLALSLFVCFLMRPSVIEAVSPDRKSTAHATTTKFFPGIWYKSSEVSVTDNANPPRKTILWRTEKINKNEDAFVPLFLIWQSDSKRLLTVSATSGYAPSSNRPYIWERGFQVGANGEWKETEGNSKGREDWIQILLQNELAHSTGERRKNLEMVIEDAAFR